MLRTSADSYINTYSIGGITVNVFILDGRVFDKSVTKEKAVTYEYHSKIKQAIKGFEVLVNEISAIKLKVRIVGSRHRYFRGSSQTYRRESKLE